uniref:tRNA:m(4)X modification enzyme n=1 Tax=Macrostomum lignano TaxID=282301 RepID=A0A1I8JPZ6_9PLAT
TSQRNLWLSSVMLTASSCTICSTSLLPWSCSVQTRYAKAVLVNEILRQDLLPVATDSDSVYNGWRMIRFRFAAKPASLPDDNYDLMEDLSAYQQPWDTIPEQDLILQAEERTDLANRAAVMEVALNHPLLRDGAILVVSPCKELCNVAEVFSQCTRGAQPILVYAIELDHLTSSDLSELQQQQAAGAQPPAVLHPGAADRAAYANYRQQRRQSPARRPSLPAPRPPPLRALATCCSRAAGSASHGCLRSLRARLPQHDAAEAAARRSAGGGYPSRGASPRAAHAAVLVQPAPADAACQPLASEPVRSFEGNFCASLMLRAPACQGKFV